MSTRWRRLIGNCKSYWRSQYFKLHKTVICSEKRLFRELTIKTLKFERHLRTAIPTTITLYSRSHHVLPIGSSFKWFYDDTLLFIHYFCGSSSEKRTFEVNANDISRSMRVLWSWSTNGGALFYGNDGTWTLIPYPLIDSSRPVHPPLQTKMWQGDICSPAHFVFGGCPVCRIVVKAVRHINQESGTWTINIVKLLDGPTNEAGIEELQFHFVPDPELVRSALFTIRSVRLIPISEVQNSTHGLFCNKHHLFVQIGVGIVIRELSYNDKGDFQLSGPSHILCPEGFSWSDIGNPDCSNFVVSNDRTLVAVMPKENKLSVWNLEDGVVYSHSILKRILRPTAAVKKMFMISVGKLYSVVSHVTIIGKAHVDFFVLSTTTGRVVFETGLFINESGVLSLLSGDNCLDEIWARKETRSYIDFCHLMSVDPSLSSSRSIDIHTVVLRS